MRGVIVATAVCVLVVSVGCQNETKKPSSAGKPDTLQSQQQQLAEQLEQTKAENEQLKKQLATLAGLDGKAGAGDFYELENVKIGGFTNFYDKDKDGKKEKLIVYIQAIDKDYDIVKACGAVDIQLWLLDEKQDNALLGNWHIEPQELRKLWFTMLRTNYRLMFDVKTAIAESEETHVVKITFTDYLTGKIFKDQMLIKQLPEN